MSEVEKYYAMIPGHVVECDVQDTSMVPFIIEAERKFAALNRQTNWDRFYLGMAEYVSTKSKDPSTKCGAVIVRPDFTQASAGYNGFPKRMPDKQEWYDNREEKYSRVVHCEMNALIHAREPVEGYTLYTWPFACCDRCAVHMIQAGISRFVFPKLPEDKVERWGKSLAKTIQYFNECGVRFTEINVDNQA